MTYAQTKLARRAQTVIPNFQCATPSTKNHDDGIRKLFRADAHIVLWAGNGYHHWHALDTIERVAKKIYSKDADIYFLLVSDQFWHPFLWKKNIIFMKSVPHNILLSYIRHSDMCLALYHKPAWCPFYFSPLKIIDYMTAKKPVIASNYGQIKNMIVNGKNGYISNSPDTIAQQILFIKNNNRLRKNMGASGYEYVTKNRNVKIAADLYHDIFTTIKLI